MACPISVVYQRLDCDGGFLAGTQAAAGGSLVIVVGTSLEGDYACSKENEDSEEDPMLADDVESQFKASLSGP